ncbi:MAG: Txe/YoeB family addiction module toxin [Legionellales bacterium]|nr:Txe/YoeB family addiction module toxin [Legionellales bacterium]
MASYLTKTRTNFYRLHSFCSQRTNCQQTLADKKSLKRINSLLQEIMRHPFTGIGDPEPLRYNWTGYWSRRIDSEHRLVYKVENDVIHIAQCRYHY